MNPVYSPIELAAFFFILGAIFGSFGNALAWRLPNGISIADGRSVCPQCERQLRWFDNIPILSYVLLGGKCGQCANQIPLRYLLLELAMGLVFAFNSYWFGTVTMILWACAFSWFILVLSAIDFETMLLPDKLTLPGFIVMLGFAVSGGVPVSWQVALASGFGAAFGLWLIGYLFRVLRGIDGLGFGDVKLMLMIGATVGFPGVLHALILGSVTGAVYGIVTMAITGNSRSAKIPFGPFLGAGGLLVLWFAPWIEMILMGERF